MDWIERLTGMDPDGGSGLLELAVLVAVVVAVALLLARRRRRRVLESRTPT